jgi:hypothetical protein
MQPCHNPTSQQAALNVCKNRLLLRSLSIVTKRIGLQRWLRRFRAALMYQVVLTNAAVVLGSLNPVTKDTPRMPMILGRTAPDPGCGASVELGRRDTRRLLDLIGVGETLASQRIAAEEPPPAFWQIQPASSSRDKDVMQTRMLGHPGAGLRAVMATEIIRDNKEIRPRIISFDVLQESDIVRGVA